MASLQSICLPFGAVAAAAVIMVVIYLMRQSKTAVLGRTNHEMRNLREGREDTYVVVLAKQCIVGKLVCNPYPVSDGLWTLDWAPIRDSSGAKLPLPTPLPKICFELPELPLIHSCGNMYIKLVLPYDTQQFAFINPYLNEVRRLMIFNMELEKRVADIMKILYGTSSTTEALHFIRKLNELGKDVKGSSALLREEVPATIDLKPQNQQKQITQGNTQQPQQP